MCLDIHPLLLCAADFTLRYMDVNVRILVLISHFHLDTCEYVFWGNSEHVRMILHDRIRFSGGLRRSNALKVEI